jgi:hypothetical protein
LISTAISVPAYADDTTTTTTTTAASGAASGAATTPVGGGDAITILNEIAQYTNGTLTAVNNLPTYMSSLVQMALAWMSPDTSDETATMQGLFGTYSSSMVTSNAAQLSMQPQILSDYFGTSVTTTTLPYANDLSYISLLGKLYFTPDPRVQAGQPSSAVNPAYNYIENAAATSFTHTIPGGSWSGYASDQIRYASFYKAVSAVQTFDAYVISQALTDYNAGTPAAQAQLLTQASSSDWFAHIASEQIGIVLRQILMYNSQTFVVLSELLQTAKQQVEAQAMTNTMLIIEGASNESILMSRAMKQVKS